MYGIFTYIWLIFMVNVGKYTSPMDAMGNRIPTNKSEMECQPGVLGIAEMICL